MWIWRPIVLSLSYFNTDPDQTGGVIISKFGYIGIWIPAGCWWWGDPRLSFMNMEVLNSASPVRCHQWWELASFTGRSEPAIVTGDDLYGRHFSKWTQYRTMPSSATSLTNHKISLSAKIKMQFFSRNNWFYHESRKGTIADAKTYHRWLYKWGIQWPFLRDFAGNERWENAMPVPLKKE